MTYKVRCGDCKKMVEDVFNVKRRAGGSYNRGQRTYSRQICVECLSALLRSLSNRYPANSYVGDMYRPDSALRASEIMTRMFPDLIPLRAASLERRQDYREAEVRRSEDHAKWVAENFPK